MQRTALICNRFSGINRSSSVYSSSVITASDIQNVELFATEVNSGVGIRTSKGNVAVCSQIPADERVINIFESIQGGVTYFFVHTENSSEGKIYLFSVISGTLTLKVSGLSVTSKSCATDVSQGWSDLWVFSNSEEMLSIELNNYNEEGELDEVVMMNLKDGDNRDVKGLGLVIFAGRLWVFNGQILWYSQQENIYDFSTSSAELATSAGYIEFVKNITAIYPYLGTLAVFHSNSSCLIAIDDDSSAFYKTMDSPGGCASYNALVFHGTELYFYDDTKKGVFCFRQVVNGDKTLGDNIAVDIQEELFNIPMAERDNIRAILETLDLSKAEIRSQTQVALENLGLTKVAKQKAFTLSGGERRRLEITRALVTHPQFLLMDEPFSGVDPISVQEVQQIILDLKKQNIGILITDHNVRETLRVVDRAYLLYDGKVLSSGDRDTLLHDPQSRKFYLGEQFEV